MSTIQNTIRQAILPSLFVIGGTLCYSVSADGAPMNDPSSNQAEAKLKSSVTRVEPLKDTFDSADANGDGFLDAEESSNSRVFAWLTREDSLQSSRTQTDFRRTNANVEFDVADSNQDDMVSWKELLDYLQSLSNEEPSSGDQGVIGQSAEAVAETESDKGPGLRPEDVTFDEMIDLLVDKFDKADEDGSGSLTLDEARVLQSLARSEPIGESPPAQTEEELEEELLDGFERSDADENGEVSKEEFIDVFEADLEPLRDRMKQ